MSLQCALVFDGQPLSFDVEFFLGTFLLNFFQVFFLEVELVREMRRGSAKMVKKEN